MGSGAISDASNLCTAVGEDQNKEFRGNASFLREEGPGGGIKIYCHCIFHIVLCWTVISHQSCSPFPSTSVGALGLFTFLPQFTVHNIRISEVGVPVYSSLVWPMPIPGVRKPFNYVISLFSLFQYHAVVQQVCSFWF